MAFQAPIKSKSTVQVVVGDGDSEMVAFHAFFHFMSMYNLAKDEGIEWCQFQRALYSRNCVFALISGCQDGSKNPKK